MTRPGAGAVLVLALATLGLGATPARAENHKAASGKPALVELFTSQGCSSCPKANLALEEVARDPGVLALTYSVTYWDYRGWKDTFAQPEFTERQKIYSRRFSRVAYTPQMVVDGAVHTSGLKKAEVRRLVSENDMLGGARIDASLADGKVRISISGATPASASEVWLAQYRPGAVHVNVKRGENAGAKIPHFNVVTALTRLGDWKGGQAHFKTACAPACVVIVQEGGGGRVIAAQGVTLTGS